MTSLGHGWVATAGQSTCRCRVSLGAAQCLRLVVAKSRGPALVVSRLCARPGLAWPPTPHATCMYCQVTHRTALCLPYHLASPCSVRSQPLTSPTPLLLVLPPTASRRHTATYRWPHRHPKGSTRALTMQPLPSLVRLCPHAAMPCRVLAGLPPPGPLPAMWRWQ